MSSNIINKVWYWGKKKKKGFAVLSAPPRNSTHSTNRLWRCWVHLILVLLWLVIVLGACFSWWVWTWYELGFRIWQFKDKELNQLQPSAAYINTNKGTYLCTNLMLLIFTEINTFLSFVQGGFFFCRVLHKWENTCWWISISILMRLLFR